MKTKARFIIESRLFTIIVQTLILLSITQLSIETIPSISAKCKENFKIVELIFTILFLIEYMARLYAANKRIKFIFSFFGLVDIISILPSILTLGVFDLRFIRSLRLIRVFRILKLARYNKALNRLKFAFKDIKEELIIFSSLTLIILFISASGIYYFEKDVQPEVFKSIPHSLWWSVATLTTVGYGDIYPVTAGGKIFTTIILFLGLGIISIPTGLFASAFSKRDKKTEENQSRGGYEKDRS